jgi:hypothetical protein
MFNRSYHPKCMARIFEGVAFKRDKKGKGLARFGSECYASKVLVIICCNTIFQNIRNNS